MFRRAEFGDDEARQLIACGDAADVGQHFDRTEQGDLALEVDGLEIPRLGVSQPGRDRPRQSVGADSFGQAGKRGADQAVVCCELPPWFPADATDRVPESRIGITLKYP